MRQDEFYEAFWDALLSRDAERVRTAFAGLDEPSRAEVVKHLRKMVGEAGWHGEQKKSARAALKAIKDLA